MGHPNKLPAETNRLTEYISLINQPTLLSYPQGGDKVSLNSIQRKSSPLFHPKVSLHLPKLK